MNKESFGTTLKKARLERELSRFSLSEKSGVSENEIRNLELDKISKPHLSTLTSLCTTLELDLDQALKHFCYAEDNTEAETFGAMLKKARLKKRLTLGKLSEIINISENELRSLELDEILKPYLSTLTSVCTTLELDLEQALKFFDYIEDDTEAKTFGVMLKEARFKKGLTIGKLSEKSGVSENEIRNLEFDRIEKPHLSTLISLCTSLKLHVDKALKYFDYAESFGTMMKKTRLEKDLTIIKLSEISGVSASVIVKLEANSTKKPRISILRLICESLELDLKQALTFFGYLEDNIEAKTFGAMLKKARLEKGLSVSELSEKSGSSEFAIDSLEADKIKTPHRSTLVKLCESLDLDLDKALKFFGYQ